MDLQALLAILNIAAPLVGSVIVAIKNANGTTSVMTILDSADAQFAANQKQISDWLALHGKQVSGVAAPPA